MNFCSFIPTLTFLLFLMAGLTAPVTAEKKPTKMNATAQSEQPQGELIFLRDFGTDEVGYLAIPQQQPKAAVVVAHGKFGLNTNIRLLCDQLARDGYLALAVDLFNGSVPANAEEVEKYINIYFSDATVSALETGINFFKLSPRFKMEKVILLGIGESAHNVLATAKKNRTLAGLTLLDPKVLPNADLMKELGVPVLAFVSSERDVLINVDEISRDSGVALRMERMPEVLFDDMKIFQRTVNERVWKPARSFWDTLEIPQRSITDKLIETVF
jgi:carboxymethylenebutenolidase